MTTCREDVFILWRNHRAVVAGRNQNTLAQIDADVFQQENIPVVRRISGGGAVYHDLGNINFTAIRVGGCGHGLSFYDCMAPVRDFLYRMGIDAHLDDRNGLLMDGRKISGNAQHRNRNTVLDHGTILIDADLEMVTRMLRVTPGRFKDKAVDSVCKSRSPTFGLTWPPTPAPKISWSTCCTIFIMPAGAQGRLFPGRPECHWSSRG